MKKITKITMILFVLYIALGLTSCVTKKKIKESQELQTTYLLDQTETKFTNSINTLESKIRNSLSLDFAEKLKQVRESTYTNENESTDISVNIKAEEGKEKSATVGNTTVTSNGADITVKTTSTKSTDKKLETLNSEWSQKYNLLETSLINVTNELNEFKANQLKVNEQLNAKSESSSKETDKGGLNIWVWIILIISAVLLWFFGGKIPIVARVKSWF